MASPNSNYDDIFTTTLESRTGKLADNVSKNNALLSRLKAKNKIRPISGGSKIVEELEYFLSLLSSLNYFQEHSYIQHMIHILCMKKERLHFQFPYIPQLRDLYISILFFGLDLDMHCIVQHYWMHILYPLKTEHMDPVSDDIHQQQIRHIHILTNLLHSIAFLDFQVLQTVDILLMY